MAESRILIVGDALVELIETFMPDGTESEVTRTYHARRFDVAKTVGLKVYVVPRFDLMGDPEEAGDRGGDPMDYTFSIVVAERMPDTHRAPRWDEMDAWVDERVDIVTAIRDRLKDKRVYTLESGVKLYPTDTGQRDTCDIDRLNETGVFSSEFTNTIRQV